MQSPPVMQHRDADGSLHDVYGNESGKSAVSWPAVLGGAFIAAAVTGVLLLLGSGIGLASVSPWPNSGMSAPKVGVMAVVWLVLTQWISSGLGGYVTGRMRTKWAGVHSHEVFFRDTAHGFLTWAVAAVIGFTLAGSVAGAVVGGASRIAAGALGGASAGAGYQAAQNTNGPAGASRSGFSIDDYMVDTLFRAGPANLTATNSAAAPQQSAGEIRSETMRILTTDLRGDAVPDGDKAYLAQLVSQRTGLSQADAQARVDNVIAQLEDAKQKAKEAADTARKAAAKMAVLTFLSMLIGAFIASAAAALGGMERDNCPYNPEHHHRPDPRL